MYPASTVKPTCMSSLSAPLFPTAVCTLQSPPCSRNQIDHQNFQDSTESRWRHGRDWFLPAMKITVQGTRAPQTQHQWQAQTALPPSDLSNKPCFPRKSPRRRSKTSGAGVRVKRESFRRKSGPETPLLGWRFEELNAKNNSVEDKPSAEAGRKSGRRLGQVISSRKLGAELWRLHLTEFQTIGSLRLGLQQPGDAGVGGIPIRSHHARNSLQHGCVANNLVHNPLYDSVPKNGLQHKSEPSLQFSNCAMEGATKWDPVGAKASDELNQIFGLTRLLNQQTINAPTLSSLEMHLEQARARINELEIERRSSKKKLEQFLQKLSEEKAAWRSKEHEKIRAIMDDLKAELSREKKNRRRLEIVNSKLVNELSNAKISVKRSLQEYEKERKAREMTEKVCDELAKEIGEDKAEVEALKSESRRLWEEVEEERKMLQMAEVWREERVQMKLVDAKVMLEEKHTQMSRMIADLEAFLNSRCPTSDIEEMNKAEFLLGAATSINIQDIRELTYEPPNPSDMFSIFEDINFGQSTEKEVEPCEGYSPASHESQIHTLTPGVKVVNKDIADRHSNVYMDHSSELDKDASEWETVSHGEDQGSSYSPGSDPSVSKSFRVSNVSREWETSGVEVGATKEICVEVGSVQPRQLKASSISRLWRSCPSNGDGYKIMSAERLQRRLSNATSMPADHCSGNSDHGPPDLAGEWRSPELGNPHLSRGMKGCIEWPCSAQKSSLKARLLEARIESQKVQLRQVLKQKI